MAARRRGQPRSGVRNVRAPQRRVAGNARPSRDEDQCHSDDAVGGASRRRSETRQTPPGARPNRRAQPVGATRWGRGALPSPRVGRKSRRVTGGLRWMAIRDGASRRDRTRRTDRLVDTSSCPRSTDLRETWSSPGQSSVTASVRTLDENDGSTGVTRPTSRDEGSGRCRESSGDSESPTARGDRSQFRQPHAHCRSN